MSFPCKENSHRLTLFANFCHQSLHQVVYGTLNNILVMLKIIFTITDKPSRYFWDHHGLKSGLSIVIWDCGR